MRIIIWLIFTILASLPTTVYAVNKCEALFESSILANPSLIVPSFGVETQAADVIKRLVEKKDRDDHTRKYYEIYLKKLAGREVLSVNEQNDFVKEYQTSILRDILDPVQLAKMRNEALNAELDNRGAPEMNGVLAKDRLRVISKQNFDRIWQEQELSLSYKGNPEIMQIIENLEFRISRNSRDPRIQGDGIYSSRQLENLTGRGGLNSKYSFNHEFLMSDDNIYFYFELTKKTQEVTTTSEYGKHGLSISANSIDLPPEVWVSPYIMYEADLMAASAYMKEVTDHFPEFDPQMDLNSKHVVSDKTLIEVRKFALKKMYRYDFTLEDITALIEAKLGQMLMPTAEESVQVKWQKLSSNGPTELRFIEKITSKLRFSRHNYLELKIPVFLPKSLVDKQW